MVVPLSGDHDRTQRLGLVAAAAVRDLLAHQSADFEAAPRGGHGDAEGNTRRADHLLGLRARISGGLVQISNNNESSLIRKAEVEAYLRTGTSCGFDS